MHGTHWLSLTNHKRLEEKMGRRNFPHFFCCKYDFL